MEKTAKLLALVLGLLVCLLTPAAVFAESSVQLSVYRVGGLNLPAQEVIAGKYKASEIYSPKQAFTAMPETSGWWRIELHDDIGFEQDYLLYLSTVTYSESEVWFPDALEPLKLNQLNPNANRGFSPRKQVFLIPSGMKAGQSIYFRFKATEIPAITVNILDENVLRINDENQSRLHNLIEGTILALVLAGFVLSVMLKERTFLILAIGTLFSFLFILANNGDIYYIHGIGQWYKDFPLQRIFGAACFGIMAYFTYVFLEMQRYTPRLALIQRILIILFALLFFASFTPVLKTSRWIPVIGNIAIILAAFIGVACSIILIRLGNRLGKLYLLSWLPLFAVSFWRIIEITFQLPENETASILLPASYVIVGILLYSGLGERMLLYKRERDVSERLAKMDPLTDIYNRRALDERLRIAAMSSEKNGSKLSILFADIDHFKKINDSYGHAVGDEVLKVVAKRISSVLRFGDVLGRYGGEEFVIGLLDTNEVQARALAERIRQSISEHPISSVEHKISVTISIGVSVLSAGLSDLEQAMLSADRALYHCKQNGRNRIFVTPIEDMQ
jgi:diguanylate cyclase (GGDEF)-like protein